MRDRSPSRAKSGGNLGPRRLRHLAMLGAFALVACSSATSDRPAAGARTWVSASTGSSNKSAEGATLAVSDAAEPASATALAKAAPSKDDGKKRIGALGPHTWIWKGAARVEPALGKMRIGTSIVLRSPDPVHGPGCPKGFYAIEPRGYVCLDETSTLNLDDPYYKTLEFSAPDPGVWPYRYAHSDDAPMYSRVPTPEEWEKAERKYGKKGFKPLGPWAIGHEELITGEPIQATDEVPYFLVGGKRSTPAGNFSLAALVWRRIPAGSMLAYSRAFEMHGRVWLLTPDTMIVPADRVSAMRRSTFKGVHLSEGKMSLPFGWNRSKGPIPKFERKADGTFVETSDTIPAKSPVEIVLPGIKSGDAMYFELRNEPGKYFWQTKIPKKVLDAPTVVVRAVTELPKYLKPGDKWIQVKIVPGTLTAYVGLTPVFTTLFSPGKGGPPAPGLDAEKYATTATGFFPLEWKERVATMSNEAGEPKVLWFTDVPNQQYLRAPLAMHMSYWHEDFGKRKSAECVNVSPIDSNFLFGWTAPQLPPGWNGARPGDGNGLSTPIEVTAYE